MIQREYTVDARCRITITLSITWYRVISCRNKRDCHYDRDHPRHSLPFVFRRYGDSANGGVENSTTRASIRVSSFLSVSDPDKWVRPFADNELYELHEASSEWISTRHAVNAPILCLALLLVWTFLNLVGDEWTWSFFLFFFFFFFLFRLYIAMEWWWKDVGKWRICGRSLGDRRDV